jgi:hypothetical protein
VNAFDHSDVKYVTMTLWAKHLRIHRVDDTCQFKVSAPHGNPEFPFTVKTRTKWSKNVRSFKNFPDQILLGSKLWSDCVLLHLAWYLEQWLGRNIPTVKFLFTAGEDDELAPKNIKSTCKSRCKNVVWNSRAFKQVEDQVGAEEDH